MRTRWQEELTGATKIALTYVLVSVAWILTSDWLLDLAVGNSRYVTVVQTTKGLTFVLISGFLIFGLVRREQRELAATNEDLERALKHTTVLHRLLRHNLRNSCDVIQNSIDLLESGRGDRAANRERIRRQASNLSAIAAKSQHLREVVSDETGLLEQDLAALVEEGVTAAREEYPDATFVLESPTTERVLAHPRLCIAIEELLTNAVVHDEAESPRVTVAFDRDGGEAVVRITDDGPGLPDIERTVLEDGVEDTLTHSRGIGLWVVRFIVTASGGSLSVSASEGEGTIVSIGVPVAETNR